MDMLSELSWLSVMIVLTLYKKIVNVGRLRGIFDTRHNDLSTIAIKRRRFSTIEKNSSWWDMLNSFWMVS